MWVAEMAHSGSRRIVAVMYAAHLTKTNIRTAVDRACQHADYFGENAEARTERMCTGIRITISNCFRFPVFAYI